MVIMFHWCCLNFICLLGNFTYGVWVHLKVFCHFFNFLTKGNNFHGFLFVSLDEEVWSKGWKNAVRYKVFFLSGHALERRRQIWNSRVAAFGSVPIHLNTVSLFRLLDKQLVIPSVLFYVITLSFVLCCAVSEVYITSTQMDCF